MKVIIDVCDHFTSRLNIDCDKWSAVIKDAAAIREERMQGEAEKHI